MAKKEEVQQAQAQPKEKEFNLKMTESEAISRIQEIESNSDFQLFLKVSHGARLNDERLQYAKLIQIN